MPKFLDHPRGLATMFLTEFWERFSYYGMRALLILFMTASVERGGLGFDVVKAGAIYGIYVAMAYLVMLPGGWIADRLIGQRKAVLYGGLVIACGHYALAIPRTQTFYLGLGLIVLGTGLLKPNVSTMVGQLYGQNDVRRDAGFSIFYMGINLGALVAPLVCSYVGEKINWHYGFGSGRSGYDARRHSVLCGLEASCRCRRSSPGQLSGQASTPGFSESRIPARPPCRRFGIDRGFQDYGNGPFKVSRPDAGHHRRRDVLVAVPNERLDPRRAQTPVGRPNLLFRFRIVLVSIRAGGLHPEPFRGIEHQSQPVRRFSHGMVSIRGAPFRHPSGAAIRLALGEPGPMGALHRIEVRRGSPLRRVFLPDSGSDCRADQQQPPVAHLELFSHNPWRTLLKPRGSQRDDEACSGKSRRPDDGFLVPFRCSGKLHWWYSCFLLSLFPIVAAVWNGGVDRDLRRPRDVPVGPFYEKIDGWRELSSGGSQMMMPDSNHSPKRA